MLGQSSAPHLTIEHLSASDRVCLGITPVVGALNRCLTTVQVGRVLVDDGAVAMGADGGVLAVLNDDRRELLVVRAHGCLAGLAGGDGRRPVSADEPLAEAVRSGQPVWLASRQGWARPAGRRAAGCASGTSVTVPLAVDGIVLGVAAWCFGRFDLARAQRTSVQRLCRAGSEAIYRAALYQRERLARAAAEHDLRRTASTLDGVPEAIIGLDRRGQCCTANAAAQRLLRRSREALLETPVWEHLPAELGAGVRSAIERAIADGAESVVHADGPDPGERLLARVRPTASGAVVRISRAGDDPPIGEAGHGHDAGMRGLPAAAALLVWSSDADGRRTHLSRGWLAFTGRPLAEALGDGWRSACHAADLAVLDRAFASARRTHTPVQCEYRLRRADGEYRWVLETAAPCVAPDGSPGGYVGICVDVTERRGGGDARLRFLEQINAMLESAPEPTAALARVAAACVPTLGDSCAVDLVDGQGRLQRVADTGASDGAGVAWRRAALGRGLPRAVRDGQSLVVACAAGDGTRAGGSPRLVRRLRELGWSAVLMVPLRTQQRTLGALTVARWAGGRSFEAGDVALAHLVARRCAAAIEDARLVGLVQEVVQEREMFVAATSHELRTPLSHIKGFVSTLRAPDALLDAATRDDFLSEIEREADRLAQLVDDLLDMSRTEAAGVDPAARANVAVATLVGRGIERIAGSLGAHGLEFEVPDTLPLVRADATQIERVIANLLHNAAKYSPPHEPIRVVARLAEACVQVRVEDRGLGIPVELSEQIFEPFFRVPAAGYPVKPGSGLGLAICRSIVRAHHGRIWVEARPGGGAAFVFSLPVAAAAEPK